MNISKTFGQNAKKIWTIKLSELSQEEFTFRLRLSIFNINI